MKIKKVKGVKRVKETKAVERVEGAEAVAPTQAAQAVAALEPLQQAFDEVLSDLKAGRLPDREAVFDGVVIRLVNLRYGHLKEEKRRELILSIHDNLSRDPRFTARLDALVEASKPTSTEPDNS